MSTRSLIAALVLPALALANQAGAAPRHQAMSAKIKAGSSNIAVIEPPITVPRETPCIVTLYANAQFGANNVPITYAPPPGCPGPWAKIVLAVDVGLDRGIQYDRTGTIFLGSVPLWFGTTSEPTPELAPQWHVERDVTDYTALLAAGQTGFVSIGNYTNSQDTSIITTSAELRFYPATSQYPAPRVPDQVIALAPAGGGTTSLNVPTDMLTITPTLPTNVVSASLDVYLQGQSGDEFWYTCVPTALSSELQSCGGGTFREGEISIDGTPAGVAPVYPWIFTGGIDPYLWLPIPGVQTLNFKPFRVDLSPFAGVLSNGQPHSISLSLAGANSYFSVTGAMFLYMDPNTPVVTGAVTQNTLTAPNPVTTNTIVTNNGAITGRVDTAAHRDFTIAGTITTSTGKVANSVHQTSTFKNDQVFDIAGPLYKQVIAQGTDTTVETESKGATDTAVTTTYTYPLSVKLVEHIGAKTITQATAIDQQYLTSVTTETNGQPTGTSSLTDAIKVTDTLMFDANFNLTGHKNQSSTATYITQGADGCFERVLVAANNTLQSVANGCN